jgi:hypothetical protein
MPIFFVWIFFRLLTSVIAALVSSIHPFTQLEKSIPLLPPSSPLGAWIERAFLSPWLRWDAVWYQRIVDQGYSASDGTAQFHPLYPWLASSISSVGAHPLLGLLLVSSLSCLGFLYVFYRLVQMECLEADAAFSTVIMLLAPSAFVLFAPYPESLFLLCGASCFYLARKRRWWLAAFTGSLATLTRQQGIFLFVPLVYELWDASGKTWLGVKASWHKLLALALIPGSYILWILYRHFVFGEQVVKLDSIQSMLYSLFISPSAIEVVPQQTFIWPWKAVSFSIQKLVAQPDVGIWVNLILAVIYLIRLYSAIIILISFSFYTGPIHPYMGLPRHLLLAFPIFIYASPFINRPIVRPVYLTLSGLVYLLLIYLYVLEVWVV